jgi:putative DNA primase/helicase
MAKKVKRNFATEISDIAEGTDEWGRRYFLLGAEGKRIPHLPPILASRLISNRKEVVGELVNAGFNLFTRSAEGAFVEKIQKWGKKQPSFRVATKLGWNGQTYVLPDRIFNPQKYVYSLLDELNRNTISKYRKSKNTLKDWQEKIGTLCLNNSRLMFSTALAFTGPILRFVDGIRSGGFQIYGDPETGKSTAAMVDGSVWGCHRQVELGFLEGWNTTPNAVEVTALAHNDGLLILDETRKAGGNPTKRLEVVLEVTMRLAEQQEKNRLFGATVYRSWRCYFLSTSNFSLDEMAAQGGSQVDDADRGRLVDIPLPKGAHGIYEDLHGFADGSDLTDRFKMRCRIYYGVPIRVFLGKLLIQLRRGKNRCIERWLGKIAPAISQRIETASRICKSSEPRIE